MKEFRIGILGCGHIGQVHLQTALKSDNVVVPAIADKQQKWHDRAKSWGVPRCYDDFETLLAEEELDAAVVALPPFLHVPAVKAAGKHSVDVFVEKPFARTVEEAIELNEIASEAGIRIGVDHTWRYYPHIRAMKERYDDGEIGHVPICSIARFNSGPFATPPASEPLSEWKLDPEATGGGALLSLGVHMFDVLHWFFGEITIDSVQLDRQLDIPFEDTATVVVSTESGTTATLHCGIFQWGNPPDVNMRFRLEGVADSLAASEFEPNNMYAHAGKSMLENMGRRMLGRSTKVYGPTFYLQAHFDALRDFIDAVRDGRDPPVDGNAGVRTVRLVEEAYNMSDLDIRGESS